MTSANRQAIKYKKTLPLDQRYCRLQEVFEEEFIKKIEIAPSVYRYNEREGSKKGGNKGMIAKRSLVHTVFSICFEYAVTDMVEENKVFKAQTYPKLSYMFIGTKKEEDCNKLFAKKTGIYQEFNPIELDFKLYNCYFVTELYGKLRSFPIKIQYNPYKRLMSKLKQGFRYCDNFVKPSCDINTIGAKTYEEDILKLFPGLTVDAYLKIIREGFTRIRQMKKNNTKILISNRRYGISYRL